MTKMTIEERKGKGREELAQLKKDGKIGWNELLLSSYELFPETYLEWLDGDEPCEEAAEEFLSSDCSDSDGALETLYYFYGVLTAYEYLTSLSDTYWPKAVYQDWLDGREPTEENAEEFMKIPEKDYDKFSGPWYC